MSQNLAPTGFLKIVFHTPLGQTRFKFSKKNCQFNQPRLILKSKSKIESKQFLLEWPFWSLHFGSLFRWKHHPSQGVKNKAKFRWSPYTWIPWVMRVKRSLEKIFPPVTAVRFGGREKVDVWGYWVGGFKQAQPASLFGKLDLFVWSPLKLGEDEPMFYSCFFGWVQTSNHQVEKLNQCWRPHMHWFSSEGILLRGCSNLWFRIHTAPGRKIKEWCPCKRGSQVWHHGSLMQIPSRILQKSHHSAHG